MKKLLLFFILHSSFFILCNAQIITTIGGGNIGNNVTGTAFGINPYSMVPDNNGNIYIADATDRIVNKLSSSGILTVVAGTGSYGYSGDGGQASNAQLEYPVAVALDNAGNLYVVDESAQCVRKINLVSGTITTFAGNGDWGYNGDNIPATNAKLWNPLAIVFDTLNNLYISDYSNNRIRKVAASNGIISTIAGNDSTGYNGDHILADSARLHSPAGIAIDKFGNIYFSDQNNCRIRMIKKSNDTIYTISGGKAGFSGDGGPAPKAEFWYPLGIAVDASGNVYIADTYENRVRKITIATDTIRTICGTGSGTFSGDGGLATAANLNSPHYLSFDASGNLYIADMGNNRIRELYASNGTITTLAGDGMPAYNGNNIPAVQSQLCNPTDMAVDSVGNVYVVDNGNNMIREIQASTGNILKIAGDGIPGGAGDNGPAGKAQLNGVDGIALNDTGNLFIADENNQRIREVKTNTNEIITRAGNGAAGYSGDGGLATEAELYDPVDVTFDQKGDMFIADMVNNRIREVAVNSKDIKTIAGNGYNAKNFNGGFSGDGGKAVSAELYQPQGLAVDKQGNLYIADTWNDRIRKVNMTTGIITTVAGNGTWNYTGDGGPATAAELGIPTSITFDAIGNLYIADYYNNVIRMVSVYDSTITTVAGNTIQDFSGDGGPAVSAELDLGHGVAFDHSGTNLYIADYGNNRIREISGPLSINQLSVSNGQMRVYPDPSSGIFYITITNYFLQMKVTNIDVYNMLGEKVYSKLEPRNSPFTIDLSNKPNGVYFIMVQNGNKQWKAKIVKE